MRNTLFIVLLFTFFGVNAQCDLSTISDPATGVSVTETEKITIVNGIKDKTSLRFRISDIDYLVYMDIKTFTDVEFKVSVTDSLIFHFDDGTNLVIFPQELYYLNFDKNLPTQLVHFTPEFYIAQEDLELLTTKKINRYELKATGKSFDFEVKSKYVKDVQKAAQCILDAE